MVAAETMSEHEPPDEPADDADYNYVYFDEYMAEGGHRRDEAAFRVNFRAGDPAADFSLPRLADGARVELASLWKSKPLVMEFGSFT
jgi:hypothetical protein